MVCIMHGRMCLCEGAPGWVSLGHRLGKVVEEEVAKQSNAKQSRERASRAPCRPYMRRGSRQGAGQLSMYSAGLPGGPMLPGAMRSGSRQT